MVSMLLLSYLAQSGLISRADACIQSWNRREKLRLQPIPPLSPCLLHPLLQRRAMMLPPSPTTYFIGFKPLIPTNSIPLSQAKQSTGVAHCMTAFTYRRARTAFQKIHSTVRSCACLLHKVGYAIVT